MYWLPPLAAFWDYSKKRCRQNELGVPVFKFTKKWSLGVKQYLSNWQLSESITCDWVSDLRAPSQQSLSILSREPSMQYSVHMTYTWAILLWLLAVGYPLVVAESTRWTTTHTYLCSVRLHVHIISYYYVYNCIYICIYVYMYIYVCIYIYIYIYIHNMQIWMLSIPPCLQDFTFHLDHGSGPRFHLDLSLCINLSDIAHLGNSVRILLEGPLRSSEDVPGSFSLKLDKSGVRINRAPGAAQGTMGCRSARKKGLN